MLEYDFDNSLGYWLCSTSHALEQLMNQKLQPEGITYRQCQVLAWLALEGDSCQADLAEKMKVEPPTLVGILDRMEREGWISREGCSEDRRRKIIRPLDRARPVWARIVKCANEVRTLAAEGLSAEEVSQLQDLLSRVRTNLEAALGVPQPLAGGRN
ncbi:MAG: MarR family transcriptional regulator [Planctomycetales bacterium]